MTSPQFAARVDGRPAKDGWLARCPGHDDHRSSLTIGSGHDGRVLLKCHAGCTPETIVAAAGLTLQDLFPVKPVKKKNGIVATYDYRDAAGGLQYQVVRYDPKDFRHRRPDGNGGWIWNMERVPRVLFGLPDLPAQLTHVRQKVVYIVEGEKDVLRLRDLGIIATTNAGGASKNPKKPKWRAEYTAQLQAAGARAVYIPPDNDDPGRAHAEAVAQSCSAAGLSVKVLTLPDLPPKGDVSDWFAAGQTRDDLIRLAEAAPLCTTDTAAASTETLSDTLDQVEAFIRKYMVLSSDQSSLTALWTAQAHAARGASSRRCEVGATVQ